MDRPKLALLAISLCIASLIPGCGSSSGNSSSSHLPPSPLQITTQSPLPSGRVNVSYNTAFTATGGVPPYSWSASNVPSGLVMSPAGALSDTPSQGGSFTLAVAVSDAARGSANGNFAITIAAPSSLLQIITQSPLPSGRVNTAYNATFTATGGVPPYAWTASSLPPGLVMSTAGALSGTPSQAGSFNAAVAVSDSAQGSANGSFAITIATPLQITTTSLPSGSPGVFYSATLSATGGFTPYTWSISQGNLPAGLTLNATSGAISGTPMSTGTSSLTVQLTDNGMPAAKVTANLSITITAAPARGAALYMSDGTGLQIASDGSVSPLPSSPEGAIGLFAYSPTLPLVFTPTAYGSSTVLQAWLVNPDYSLSLTSTSPALPSNPNCGYPVPVVDPTGSNIYVTGCIDSGGDAGILIYSADGTFQSIGTIAISDPGNSRMTFNPNGTLGFIPNCPSGSGSIVSYSRAPNGGLTLVSTYNLPAGSCAYALQVSPDGHYLAVAQETYAVVQVFFIGRDGSLSPATQPLTVQSAQGQQAPLVDLVWDSSGSYLLPALDFTSIDGSFGGVAVVSFSGSSLTQTAYATGDPPGRILRDGSFVYGMVCDSREGCFGLEGFDFQNGQLNALPGSPWYQYGSLTGDIVIY